MEVGRFYHCLQSNTSVQHIQILLFWGSFHHNTPIYASISLVVYFLLIIDIKCKMQFFIWPIKITHAFSKSSSSVSRIYTNNIVTNSYIKLYKKDTTPFRFICT
jgi:hypothetical protein